MAADWTPQDTQRHFFREAAETYDSIAEDVLAAVRGDATAEESFEDVAAIRMLRSRLGDDDGSIALQRVVQEALRIFAHGFFATLDGAAADTDEEIVRAVDAEGRDLDEGLHELWVEFLFDTGRLT